MTWSLPHNLKVREAAVDSCWPHATIYAIGDQAHQAEAGGSDHNPDSRGIVHAIDVMFAAGTPEAIATLKWALSWTDDLEYVIHNHLIYERSHGFRPIAYTGTDPHTNHIHISGRHGSVGRNSATGTGYDVAAEAMTPPGNPLEDAMAGFDTTDAATLLSYVDPVLGQSLHGALKTIYDRTALLNALTPTAIATALVPLVVAQLPAGGGATPEQIAAAVHAELGKLQLAVAP